ncbi:heme ABC exporter ATP-binding protein CcmA [Rhodobacteraceae bacterium]|nr:heme ABC exporter ATP-binding protein CcmA [Paracoccaceae bacterium]
MSLLHIHDLCVARGGMAILQNLCVTLDRGQAIVLRGPNGIGKTTLLRTIAGLQPGHGGTIKLPAEGVAYAGHADGLKPSLSVLENLQFWASVYGGRSIEAALDQMNLADLQHRTAQTLSAGQKRRLGLARLMVTGRALWVMDEPTVSLDTRSVALFAQIVRQHLAAGGAAVMATHIDLGLPEAHVLDLTDLRARARGGFTPGDPLAGDYF